ncbi:ubiquitinyl hydrolase 1 [Ranunculus cassubicifolius]
MEELCRSTRDIPPSHFMFKVEFFSKLSSSTIERYESEEFSVGDYKWKLRLYPNGNNKKANGKDNISLYLVAANKIDLNKEIVASFCLLAFDHVRNTYLSVQAPVSRFTALKSEYGFGKFLPLAALKDPSKGYLCNDTCIFGAEVFVIQNNAKGQCLTMCYEDKKYYSQGFSIADHNWKLAFYPKGCAQGKGTSMSLFLHLADSGSNLGFGREILTKFTLRVVDQFNNKHKELTATHCFKASAMSTGWPKFLPLSNLNKGTGYLVNDTCVVEVEITVLGSAKSWV